MGSVRSAAVVVCAVLFAAATTGSLIAPLDVEAAGPTGPEARDANVAGPAADGRVAGGADVADTSGDARNTRGDGVVLEDPRMAATDVAHRVLAGYVSRTSRPDAFRTALRAYFNFRHANPDAVRKPYFYYVDMGLDNGTARGYVFDMDRLVLIDGPFHVSHGRGSLRERNGVPARFSNVPGSFMTSLGLYVAEETYGFRGTSNGRAYTSVGLRLRGESGAFNDAARRRGIVAHGAPYVSARDAGRSEGCPAMEQHRADRLLPKLANGGVVFIYSPLDAGWLAGDPWLNAN